MNALPPNWTLSKIKDIAETMSGGTPSTNKPEYWDGDVPWINSGKLKDGIIDTPSRFISKLGLKESSAKLFPRNTVVIALTGATTGKVGFLNFETATNQSVTGILPNENYDSKLLFYQLMSLRSEILSKALGTAQPHINKGIVDNTLIKFPPLNEQKQISKKLDEIFGHLDLLNNRLDRIPELIRAFKEKVLTYAVTGKLTEEWRKHNKISKQWKTERADVCCEKVQNGGTPKKGVGFSSSGYPFLKVYNIVNQKIDFDYRPQFIDMNSHKHALRKSICLPGDVLMNIVGPPLCKVAIVSNEYPEWNINQAITLFRPKEYLSNKFLYYFFCEGSSVKAVMPETRGVVGQINISLSQCRDFSIPIPSIEEQNEIVKVVEKLFLLSEQVESYYKNLKKLIVGLPEATLEKAFSGNLLKSKTL